MIPGSSFEAVLLLMAYFAATLKLNIAKKTQNFEGPLTIDAIFHILKLLRGDCSKFNDYKKAAKQIMYSVLNTDKDVWQGRVCLSLGLS